MFTFVGLLFTVFLLHLLFNLYLHTLGTVSIPGVSLLYLHPLFLTLLVQKLGFCVYFFCCIVLWKLTVILDLISTIIMDSFRYVDDEYLCVCVCVCREPEPSECHLKDMLQQLNTIIAAKPSERPFIRQGEWRLPRKKSLWMPMLDISYLFCIIFL